MKYKYVGDGPFPLYIYGIGVVNAEGDTVETDEVINHPHFVEITVVKKTEKTAVSEGEK